MALNQNCTPDDASHVMAGATLVKLKILCTWTAKTTPCFAFYGLRGNVTKNTQQHATPATWLLAKTAHRAVY
jgi:hypothetical protein